jgi:integrase/recombinase XerD
MPERKRPVTGSTSIAIARRSDPGEYVHDFMQYLRAECGMAANTILAYRSDLDLFCEWFQRHADADLRAVDLTLLGRYLLHLQSRQLAATSVARHLVAIKMYFRYLVLEGVLRESVVELLSSPKLWQHLPHVLSPDMVNRLLIAPMAEDRFYLRDRAILTLMYATGCRASEVSSLRLRDVNLNQGFCRCVGKGNKERMVSLNPVARAALEAYLAHERPVLARRTEAEELFLSRSGVALSRIVIWKLVKKYACRVGCSDQVSPHTLRHSFATHMLAGGADIRVLQELLGHASISTTQIYTHVEHSRLKAVHRRCHPRG